MSNKEKIQFYPQDYILKYTVVPFVPEWITPNRLTLLRYFLTPVVLYLLISENYNFGVPLFLFAAFTDMLDGSIARLKNKITNWGIINDPIADKFLILSVTLLFVMKYLSIFISLGIVFTEMFILGATYILNRKHAAIPANIFGKLKMATQVLSVLLLIISVWTNNHSMFGLVTVLFIIAIIFAYTSFGFNLYKARILKEKIYVD